MAHFLIKKITEIFNRLTLGQPKYPIKDVVRISFGTGLTLFAILLLNSCLGDRSEKFIGVFAVADK